MVYLTDHKKGLLPQSFLTTFDVRVSIKATGEVVKIGLSQKPNHQKQV